MNREQLPLFEGMATTGRRQRRPTAEENLDAHLDSILGQLPPETHRAFMQRFYVAHLQQQLERLPLQDRQVIITQLAERNFQP